MKKTLAVISILMAIGSTACDTAKSSSFSGAQVVELAAGKHLVLRVDGVQSKSGESEGVSKAKDGEPIHRVLQSPDGTVLFAYDLQVNKSGAGAYRFVLNPAEGKAPTFQVSREVTLDAQDAVRVELMEQQGTGRKVEDVLSLVDSAGKPSGAHDDAFMQHLYAMHQRIYHWIHGE